MYFIEKRNCIWIRKSENHASDPVRTPGLVGYGGASPLTPFVNLGGQKSIIYLLKMHNN